MLREAGILEWLAEAPQAVRDALPADDAARHGQGRRGHGVLPLRAAARAQRRRRRPEPLSHRRRRVPRRQRAARRALPAPPALRQTHDTKRSGDVRARIGALAGMAGEWAADGAALAGAVRAAARPAARPTRSRSTRSSRRSLGAWPIEPERLVRVHGEGDARAQAAPRAGSSRTRRTRSACSPTAARSTSTSRSGRRSSRSPRASRALGELHALRQTALKLTVPGVPDIYQGDELRRALARRPRQPPPGRLGAPRAAARRAARRRRAESPTRASCG